MPPASPLDEDAWQALVDRARRAHDPVARMGALRLIIGASRFTCGETDHRFAAIEALEGVATGDLNEVLRETARHALADLAAPEAFEAWMRVARPQDGAFFDEGLRLAERVADASYATAFPGSGDHLEDHAQRALRLLEALESGQGKVGDAGKILASKPVLVRLAERAVLQAQDPGTERRARMFLEMMRSGC